MINKTKIGSILLHRMLCCFLLLAVLPASNEVSIADRITSFRVLSDKHALTLTRSYKGAKAHL